MKNLKVGDTVNIEGITSLAAGGGKAKVTRITTQYDKNSGKPYRVIWCEDHGFSERTGYAITPPTMYRIEGG